MLKSAQQNSLKTPNAQESILTLAGTRFHRLQRLRYVIFSLLLVALVGCTGLAGEPEIVITFAPPVARPTESGYPLQAPNLANGAQIFADRCVLCHGEDGRGNGELVQTGEVPQAGNFMDAANTQSQSPREWFDIITNGRLDQLMPPWANALNEQERWDVTFYTYTQHYQPNQIVDGQSAWETACGDCAEDIQHPLHFLLDMQNTLGLSDATLHSAILRAAPQLSDYQAWEAVSYLRTQNLDEMQVILMRDNPVNSAIPTPPLSSAPEGQSTDGTIYGQITNGTIGGELPDGLAVTLFTQTVTGEIERYETIADAEGNFSYDDVPIVPDQYYVASVAYRERVFASEQFAGAEAQPDLVLPVQIYDLTEDPEVITISRILSQITAVADGLQVAQFILIENTSDRVFTSSQEVAPGRYAGVVIHLPPSSFIPGLPEDFQRYVVSEDQSFVIDTAPVLPGSGHIIQLVYFIPYEGDAIIEQPLNYRMEGELRLLLRPTNLEIRSEQVQSIGVETVGQNVYGSYSGVLDLVAGDVLQFELRGSGASTAEQLETPRVVPANTLVLLLAGFGLLAVIAGAGYYFFSRRGTTDEATADSKDRLIDALIQQIAELDDAHDRGDINHDLYHHRRKQLKTRLAAIMDEDTPA